MSEDSKVVRFPSVAGGKKDFPTADEMLLVISKFLVDLAEAGVVSVSIAMVHEDRCISTFSGPTDESKDGLVEDVPSQIAAIDGLHRRVMRDWDE